MKTKFATIPRGSLQERLILWRGNTNRTQKEAATHLSGRLGARVSIRTYQGWESGRSQPHPISLSAILKAINGDKP